MLDSILSGAKKAEIEKEPKQPQSLLPTPSSQKWMSGKKMDDIFATTLKMLQSIPASAVNTLT